MSNDQRRISIGDLPESASAPLNQEDTQEAADVKGGATRVGIRAGIRVGKRATPSVRAVRERLGVRKVNTGDSWLRL